MFGSPRAPGSSPVAARCTSGGPVQQPGGSVLNVIRCKDTRRIAASALDQGWEWIGYTRAGHVEFRWPATDTRLHCATTPSDRNAWKAFARNIKQVSGVETWEKSNHRRPRKKADKSAEVQLEASRR